MFTTFKQRILLGIYLFVLTSIPIGAYLASQATQFKSSASQSTSPPPVTKEPGPTGDPSSYLQKLSSLIKPGSSTQPYPKSTSSSNEVTGAAAFGPTLSFKIKIDGRPQTNQSARLFAGIIAGVSLQNPQYLLSFTVDIPASGRFDNLSLAGLTAGNTYTAILKGDAQIATSSAFVMNPAETRLNNGQPVNMLSGDLNQDNIINSYDLQIVRAALGSTAKSSNWNTATDLNKDGTINNLDLAIINKNSGKIGATGIWASVPAAKTTASSGSPEDQGNNPPSGSPPNSSGYWIWVPN